MYHWWKINITLTNGKELTGFVLHDSNTEYTLKNNGDEYIAMIYERKTIAIQPNCYHIQKHQVACYNARYLGIENSLRGYDYEV